MGAVGEQAMRRMLVSLALALVAAATLEAGYRVVRLTDVIVLARECYHLVQVGLETSWC